MKKDKAEKSSNCFCSYPDIWDLRGNEEVNRMRPDLMQSSQNDRKKAKACARRYACMKTKKQNEEVSSPHEEMMGRRRDRIPNMSSPFAHPSLPWAISEKLIVRSSEG